MKPGAVVKKQARDPVIAAGANAHDPRLAQAFEAGDFQQLAILISGGLFVALAPERLWPIYSRAVAAVACRARPRRFRNEVALLERFVPGGFAGHGRHEELLPKIVAAMVEELILYAKLLQTPSYRPPIEVIGEAAIAEARERGHGIVIWTAPQIMGPLLVRLAAAERNWALTHLRHQHHGWGFSRFSRRVLNPLRWRVEDRHAEHLLIDAAGPAKPVREAARRLRAGRIVQIHAVARSDSPIAVPLFRGRMELALGAPRIALANGAALFGAALIRGEGGRGYRLHLRGLLEPPAGAELARNEHNSRIDHAVEEFRRILEECFAVSPDLWPIHYPQFRSD